MESLPDNARVTIIGGGVIGCSVAYHLAKLGWKDVVLLEQGKIAGGTTWHAAGMVGQLRTSNSLTKINKYSVELYKKLYEETQTSIDWNQCGSLILGTSEDRMIQLKRTAAMAKVFGVEANLISPSECSEKWHGMYSDDILGGVWLPDDGKVDPEKLAISLAKGAKKYGANIIENIHVSKILKKDNRVNGVETNQGQITSEWTILCGGMWARQLGMDIDIDIPLYPVEHHYVLSEPIEGISPNFPCTRDPNEMIYLRSEVDGRVRLGGFQKRSKPWAINRIPDDFSFKLLEEDWDYFRQPLEAGKKRIPQLQNCKIPEFVNGPESFTPDNNFIMGVPPNTDGLFVLAGFNSVGIASAGGAGKYTADWLEAGYPTMDLWSVDIRRFSKIQNDTNYLSGRVVEVLGLHYQMAWPNREMETSRDIRHTPLFERLKEKNACFGVSACWERANWFASKASDPIVDYSFEKQNWSPIVNKEVEACRNSVAIFDQSTFSKFSLDGPESLSFLQKHCGNNIDLPIGGLVYTGMFNDRGTFESDLTITRKSHNSFYLVSSTNQRIKDFDWISRHLTGEYDVKLRDITEEFGVISVMGPNSRKVMQSITNTDFESQSFPFGTSQEILINNIPVLAQRLTYVGELGWELHAPWNKLLELYEIIFKAGNSWKMKDAGHYAINTMRIEKGYRAWGHELSTDETPLEAGLSFAIYWNKDFRGKDALLKQKKNGITKRLVSLVMKNKEAYLWGNEPIICNGAVVGYTTSGAFSHTLNTSIAMGYINSLNDGIITAEKIKNMEFNILTNGCEHSADAILTAPYDPKRSKILN